jgi:hypothetical protein
MSAVVFGVEPEQYCVFMKSEAFPESRFSPAGKDFLMVLNGFSYEIDFKAFHTPQAPVKIQRDTLAIKQSAYHKKTLFLSKNRLCSMRKRI